MQGQEIALHKAVGGARGGPDECQPAGLDTVAAGLSLLTDDGGLDEHQGEERQGDDGDDPQPLSRERAGRGVHPLTLRAVTRLLHGSFGGPLEVERWLRSRP